MPLKDLLKKAFKKEEAKPANEVRVAAEVKDDEINLISKRLFKVVEAADGKLTTDQITELREEAQAIPADVEAVIDKVFDTLLNKELEALEVELKKDLEEAIVVDGGVEPKETIEQIKAARLSSLEIAKAFNEKEIVDAGEVVKAGTKMRLTKKENSELLHKAIFGGQ